MAPFPEEYSHFVGIHLICQIKKTRKGIPRPGKPKGWDDIHHEIPQEITCSNHRLLCYSSVKQCFTVRKSDTSGKWIQNSTQRKIPLLKIKLLIRSYLYQIRFYLWAVIFTKNELYQMKTLNHQMKDPHSLRQCFSNFSRHTRQEGILLKCRLYFSKWEWGQGLCISFFFKKGIYFGCAGS